MRAHLGNHRGLVMLLLFSYSLRSSTCSPSSHTVLPLTRNISEASAAKWGDPVSASAPAPFQQPVCRSVDFNSQSTCRKSLLQCMSRRSRHIELEILWRQHNLKTTSLNIVCAFAWGGCCLICSCFVILFYFLQKWVFVEYLTWHRFLAFPYWAETCTHRTDWARLVLVASWPARKIRVWPTDCSFPKSSGNCLCASKKGKKHLWCFLLHIHSQTRFVVFFVHKDKLRFSSFLKRDSKVER